MPSSASWLVVSRRMPYLPPKIWLLLTRRERRIFNNHGVTLTRTHCLGPPLFLLRGSEATLAIWSERLAKGPYKKTTPSAVRFEPTMHRLQASPAFFIKFWSRPPICHEGPSGACGRSEEAQFSSGSILIRMELSSLNFNSLVRAEQPFAIRYPLLLVAEFCSRAFGHRPRPKDAFLNRDSWSCSWIVF